MDNMLISIIDKVSFSVQISLLQPTEARLQTTATLLQLYIIPNPSALLMLVNNLSFSFSLLLYSQSSKTL